MRARDLETSVRRPEITTPPFEATPEPPASGPRRIKGRSCPEIVGESEPMREMMRQLDRARQSEVVVCVLGETGTGKELVARALHAGGARAAGPFVAINCAAIPESLLEAELFGAERGAFTGATQLRRGCFEQAGGGTLFLDELGEMSLATQARMLRVLQERTIRRLGGFEDIPVDIRIVCATRRDLGLGVRCGWFREDLYYRLVVYPIEMPALRDRRGDVPLLVEHMLGRLQQGRAQRVRWIRPEALDALERYPWPGNVRELLNVLQRALLTCEGDEIALTDLPFQIRGLAAPAPSRMRVEPDAGATIVDEVTPLEALERQAIEHALAASAGRVGKAAALLGVARSTLYRRIAAAKIPYRR